MVYTATGDSFSMDTKNMRGCDVKATWYDPLSGNYTGMAYDQCENNTSLRRFTPPKAGDHEDWTLVLESSKT